MLEAYHHKYYCVELPGPFNWAFVRLEPCAVKVASTVLRGERGGNVVLLPDLSCQ